MKWIRSRAQFEKAKVGKVALVGFCAPWCTSCRLQEPILHQLAARFEGKAFIGAVNVDENKDLLSKLGIRFIPTMIIFNNGLETDRFVGLQPESTLADAVRELI